MKLQLIKRNNNNLQEDSYSDISFTALCYFGVLLNPANMYLSKKLPFGDEF